MDAIRYSQCLGTAAEGAVLKYTTRYNRAAAGEYIFFLKHEGIEEIKNIKIFLSKLLHHTMVLFLQLLYKINAYAKLSKKLH
jgi:hypothetical protein